MYKIIYFLGALNFCLIHSINAENILRDSLVLHEVTGYIVDMNDQPLEKAFIQSVESKKIVRSDSNGKFVIPIVEGDILDISYQGLERRMIPWLNRKQNLYIQLYPHLLKIDAVEVQAYSDNKKVKVIPEEKNSGIIYCVSNEASFPPGNIVKYIKKHIHYPEEIRRAGIEGRVTVRFEVDKTGQVTNPIIARSVHAILDQEVLRVIREMPKWKPAREADRTVSDYFSCSIDFILTKQKDEE